MDDVPKSVDSALSLLRHDDSFIRRPTWDIGWSLADDNQKQVENDSRSSLESNRNNASIELVDSLMLAKSATRIAILGISTSNLNDARRINVSVMQQRGDPLLIVGSPFGLMSPFHFFNSVSVGAVAICLPPCTARSSLLMTDTHCLAGMEGAPVFDQNSCLVGLLMNPLTQKGSNIEVQLVITGDVICTEWNSKHLPCAQQMSSVSEIPILRVVFLASIIKEKSGTDLVDMVVQLFLFLDHSVKEIFATLASGPERSLCAMFSDAYVGLYLLPQEQGALSHIANGGFASWFRICLWKIPWPSFTISTITIIWCCDLFQKLPWQSPNQEKVHQQQCDALCRPEIVPWPSFTIKNKFTTFPWNPGTSRLYIGLGASRSSRRGEC
jgi:hypothetical protein